MLVGIFPRNKNAKNHEIVGIAVFSSVILTSFGYIYLFSGNNFFPKIMNYLTLAIIGSATVHVYKYHFFGKKEALFEWLTLILTIIWNFGIALTLLARIYR